MLPNMFKQKTGRGRFQKANKNWPICTFAWKKNLSWFGKTVLILWSFLLLRDCLI